MFSRMTRTRRYAVAMATLTLSGCSLMFVHGPPPDYEGLDHVVCTESNTAPVLDVLLAGLGLAGGIVLAIDVANDPLIQNTEPNGEPVVLEAIALGVIPATVLGVSAGVGFNRVKKCRAAREQLAKRHAAASAITR